MLAWPLFLSQGSSTILQFIDRMFLTWYSPQGMAATGPSGMLAFAFQSLFIGVVGYAGTFVAQYTGAEKPRQAVAVIWQALYLAILAALLIFFLEPLGPVIFRVSGHTAQMRHFEHLFFRVFMYGAFPGVGLAAISGYFIGRGLNRIVLVVNLLAVVVNMLLDYLLIFGHWGFPALGVTGAGLASVVAQSVGFVVMMVCFLQASNRIHPGRSWRPDFALMRRLLRFGSANGIQFALDMMVWTTFLLLVGRMGVTELAATNLGFQLNAFAFFPIIGFGMATSTLVGQNLGKNRADLADRAVWSAIHMSLLFTFMVALAYIFLPGWLMLPFGAEADPAAFRPVREMGMVILRFVATYCLFDVGNLIFSAALKGAGDTLFVSIFSPMTVAITMLLPILLWCVPRGGLGIYGAWTFLTLAVCILMLVFLWRYLTGHWRTMRVIEQEVI